MKYSYRQVIKNPSGGIAQGNWISLRWIGNLIYKLGEGDKERY